MDAGMLTAITGALATLGGAVAWWVARADKRREAAEMTAVKLITEQVTRLETEIVRLRQQHRDDERYHSKIKASAGRWREQLIANGIEPIPEQWPEREETP